MKYLVTYLLALPLLTSCVEQDPYYAPQYYSPAARVEVQQDNHQYRYNENRPAPQARVYHGHVDGQRNRVIVNPRAPRVHVGEHSNAHGHDGSASAVAAHPHARAHAHAPAPDISGRAPGRVQRGVAKPQPKNHENVNQATSHGHD